jgi:hypothetical protein
VVLKIMRVTMPPLQSAAPNFKVVRVTRPPEFKFQICGDNRDLNVLGAADQARRATDKERRPPRTRRHGLGLDWGHRRDERNQEGRKYRTRKLIYFSFFSFFFADGSRDGYVDREIAK